MYIGIVASSRRDSQRRSSGLISIARNRRFTQLLIFGKLPLHPLAGRGWFCHSDGRRNLSASCRDTFACRLSAFGVTLLSHRALPYLSRRRGANDFRLSACFCRRNILLLRGQGVSNSLQNTGLRKVRLPCAVGAKYLQPRSDMYLNQLGVKNTRYTKRCIHKSNKKRRRFTHRKPFFSPVNFSSPGE